MLADLANLIVHVQSDRNLTSSGQRMPYDRDYRGIRSEQVICVERACKECDLLIPCYLRNNEVKYGSQLGSWRMNRGSGMVYARRMIDFGR